MARSGVAVVLVGFLLAAGCSAVPAPSESRFSAAPSPPASGRSSYPASPTTMPNRPSTSPAIVFLNGDVITMDDATPRAQAVAISSDRIVAVGANDAAEAAAGPSAQVVDLGGRTLTPGFIDAHQHRLTNGPDALGLSPATLADAAIAQGWTMIDELYVNGGQLDALRQLDESGALRLRVNAYLPVNDNNAEGTMLGDYYTAYHPHQVISPHLRIGGLKVFTDFNNAQVLLWRQPDLDAFLLARYREGWPLAIKTVSTRSLAMIIKSFQAIKATDPAVVDARTRLEHMLFATADQIAQEKDLGLVPMINLNNPGQLVGMPDVDQLIASEPPGSYTPWRSVFDAGLPAAGISGFPSLYVDEPEGAPFGSPMHLIYQGVTRVGNLGAPSPESLMAQAITAEEGMRAHTINAARATFQEDELGSIAVGKLADFVVLSADPLAVPTEEINRIKVLMTVIGGQVQFCAAAAAALCPSGQPPSTLATPTMPATTATSPTGSNLALAATVTATSELPDFPATSINDGTPAHWNAAGPSPQSVDLALPTPSTVSAVELVVAQDPAGPSRHEVWVRQMGGKLMRVHVFDGVTGDGDVLRFVPAVPLDDVDLVRVTTTELDDLFPAWQEIRIIGQ